MQTNSLNVGEGYEDDMLDQQNEDDADIDRKMEQDWDNFVERDVGGEDPDDPNEYDSEATEAGGQAGTIWACPECGFKSISRDEYDVHNSKHGNIPATVGSPLSEEGIAVANNDYQILSRFR